MFKRIQKIIKTGVFRKADGLGSFQFERLTVFYGLNTHGKTTLKDIFRSITQNDPQVLSERESVPNDTTVMQEVGMSFEENRNETNLKFENYAWSPDTLKGKILIFDNEFTHRNLITGSAITRENRESLSDFILGEEGVKLSEEIRDLNKSVRDKKRELRAPPSLEKLTDKNEKRAFLTMKVKETKSDLEKLKDQKSKELDNLANSEKIKNLSDVKVPELKLETALEEVLALINTEFRRDYKDVTNEVMTKIENHLKKHVSGEKGLNWITEGFIKHKKESTCPFCGQKMEAVSDLMGAYTNYFNENYKTFAKEISDNLTKAESQLTQKSLSIFSAFQTLKLNLGEYKKYSSSIKDDVDLSELQTTETLVKTALEEEKKALRISIDAKKIEPHKAFDDLTLSKKFKEALGKLKEEINKTADNFESSIKEANKLKGDHFSLTKEILNQRKKALQKEIEEINLKISKLEESSLCNTYIANDKAIKDLQNQIKEKSTELESQQSKYIKKYFGELNKVYKLLGSRGFELKCVSNNKGHKKIYELKIFYSGQKVSSSNVSKVLSESDKRSLSFAIFLSKLENLKNKSKYIIVLDDPVVSFDDNRITISVDIIKSLVNSFKQVIVLTHYPSLVKKLLLVNSGGAYFEVTRNKDTSSIRELNRDSFTLSDYELAFNKIYGFVQKDHGQDISKDCRVFMEKYLQMRFYKGICEEKIAIAPLKDFLSKLKEKGYIDDTQYQSLENFREGLNPEHHNFIFNKNDEDIRTYAEDLINKLSAL